MNKYIQIVTYGFESITHIFSKLEGYLCNYSGLIYELYNDKITITINNDDIVAVEFINRIKDIMKRYNIFDFEIKIFSEQGNIQKQNALCESENILPLTQNREITLFHHHVLFRQIPINESLESWWNSNFINIYYRTGIYCFFDYTDFSSYYEPLFMKTNYMYYESEKFNNKDYFISELSKNKYLYLWVDNYYIKTAYCYKQKHDIHPVLIYGYSLDKNVYYCSCFEIKRGLFTSECTIEDIHMALESARLFGSPEFKHPPVSFLMPKVYEEKYNFGGERFLDELYNYINGKGKLDNVYFTFEHPVEHNTNNDSFGLNVTRVLIKHLLESRSKIFDYRIFHMVVENKYLILRSLKYFYEGSESKISNIILDYENLAEEYKKVRNFYIKESYLENKGQGFYPPPKRKEVINELCERLTELVAEEYNLLVLLFPLLERFLLFNKR